MTIKPRLLAIAGAALLAGAGCKGSSDAAPAGTTAAGGPYKVTQFGLQIDLPGTSEVFAGASGPKQVAIRNSNIGILAIGLDDGNDDQIASWKRYADKEKCTDFTSEKLPDGWVVLFTCKTPYGDAVTGKVGHKIGGHMYTCELSSSPKAEGEARRVIDMCKTLRAV